MIITQYREYINANGERLWIPILAGAAILSAPLWIANSNKNNCCPYPTYIQQVPYYPYQPYMSPYYQPYPPYQYSQGPTYNNYIRK